MGGFCQRRNRRELQETTEEMFAIFPRLADRRAQRGGTLSGGEAQMLSIGRALMSRPRLLMLDEPSLGLALADRGYVLEHGHVVIEGSAEQLKVDPRVRAAYLGGDSEAKPLDGSETVGVPPAP